MSPAAIGITQTVFRGQFPAIRVTALDVSALSVHTLDNFLATQPEQRIGVAAEYGAHCRLTTLAVATPAHVLVIKLGAADQKKGKGKGKNKATNRTNSIVALEDMLCRPEWLQLGFEMDRLSTSLFLDHQIRICGATDAESVCPAAGKLMRGSLESIVTVLGKQAVVEAEVRRLFLAGTPSKVPTTDVALRAWSALQAGNRPEIQDVLLKTPRVIDTTVLSDQVSTS
jgi:hypothetical protein